MYLYVTKSYYKTLKITGIQVTLFNVGLPFLVFDQQIFQYGSTLIHFPLRYIVCARRVHCMAGKQVCLTFNGLKWNAMTNMSGDMTQTLVTDFFTLPKLGQVSGSTNVRTRPDHASKVVRSRLVDRA